MKDFKISIDEDLIPYLTKKEDADKFINSLIREKMNSDKPESEPEPGPKPDPTQSPGKVEYSTKPSEGNKSDDNVKIILGFIFVVIFAVLISFAVKNCGDNKSSHHASYSDSDTVMVDDEAGQDVKMKKEIKEWNLNIQKDAMTDSKNIWASITSDNSVDFDFPYNGGANMTITVRYMKKYGYDVILQVTTGQFGGNDIEGTNYIVARFDGGSPRRYTFNTPEDGSIDNIFINRTSDFIARCKKAKSIKIEAPFYQEGRVIFDFSVDKPLKWKK